MNRVDVNLKRYEHKKVVLIQPKAFHAWEALNIGYLKSFNAPRFPHTKWEFYSGFFDSDKKIIDGCQDADYIGFSCTTPQLPHAQRLIEKIAKIQPAPQIIIGGVHASAQPHHTFRYADYVVKGEGEYALTEILNGTEPNIIQKAYFENPDSIPFPDRRFIKQERNIEQAYKDNGKRIGSILTSRGCPFKCTFCSSKEVWEGKFRYRSPKNVILEMADLKAHWDLDFIKFADDTFTVNLGRVKEICKEKMKDPYLKTLEWGCNIRANTPLNVLKEMVMAGCKEVWIGVESGSPSILKDMRKGITIEQVKNIFKLTKQLGLYRRAYFMLGMPNESAWDLRLTEELATEIDADEYGFTILAPYPNNVIFEPEMLDTLEWDKVDEYGNKTTKTKHLDNDQLHDFQTYLTDKFVAKMCFRQKDES